MKLFSRLFYKGIFDSKVCTLYLYLQANPAYIIYMNIFNFDLPITSQSQ